MPDVKVAFWGEEYVIPSELREFVEYLQYFEAIHNDLMPLLTNQIKKREYSGGVEHDPYYSDPLKKAGEKVIASLAKKQVYDVTLNDLVNKNKGYQQLDNVCAETIKELSTILMNAMQNWLNGYENAHSSATSKITGTGVSIWTNSASSLLLFSAMEASTLKKQADKADKEYRDAIGSLNNRVNSQQEREETELLVNSYYPGVAEALSVFVSEMMVFYVTKLEEKGIFA